MSKNRNNIDELFRSTFENASIPAPPSAFSAIQSQFASQSASAVSTSFSALKITAITTSILVVVGGALYMGLYSEDLSNTDVVAQENPIKSDVKGSSQKNVYTFGGIQPNVLYNPRNMESVVIYSDSINEKNIDSKANKTIQSSILENGGISNTEVNRTVSGSSSRTFDTQKPVEDVVNTLNSVSQERNKTDYINPIPMRNCKHRFFVNLQKENSAPHILALGISGDAAKFEWGWLGESLGTAQGRSADWEGPIYVKKPQEIKFWIRAHFMDGCRDTFKFSRWITPVNMVSEDIFPSVFTPNGDGFNDSFYVSIPMPKEFDMMVIDMRGNKVFSSNSPTEKWSGYFDKRKCDKGIYKVQVRRKYSGDLQFDVKNFTVELR